MVENKAQRVANFHRETVTNLVELVGAAGLDGIHQLKPKHISRRVAGVDVKTYAQLYPTIGKACLLDENTIPESWKDDWELANAASW